MYSSKRFSYNFSHYLNLSRTPTNSFFYIVIECEVSMYFIVQFALPFLSWRIRRVSLPGLSEYAASFVLLIVMCVRCTFSCHVRFKLSCCCASWGGMHSQASHWLSIGFKQMVCTVATCYWFLVLLWFYKPEAFFPLNITTGSLIAQSFFYLY